MRVIRASVLVAVVLIITGAILFRRADGRFYNSFLARAAEMKAGAGSQTEAVVTEKDLAGLPEPVIRYMRFTGVIGNKRISSVHLYHGGQFKTSVKGAFVPIRGEYFLTTKKPSYAWYGKIFMAPGLPVAAFDSYFDGTGRMLVKALSLITLVDAQSRETDNSAFGRCVAEMIMAPTFFLDRDLIRWTATGRDSARCTIIDAGFSTEAELFVNPDGSLARIVVMRYFDRGSGTATLERFTGAASNFRKYAGYRLPAKLDGYWNLPEGDLHYVNFDMDYREIE